MGKKKENDEINLHIIFISRTPQALLIIALRTTTLLGSLASQLESKIAVAQPTALRFGCIMSLSPLDGSA